MKHILLIGITCAHILINYLPNLHSEATTNAIPFQPSLRDKEFESLCSVISELAVKKYQEDALTGKTYILTLHDDDLQLAKYTDGEFVIVSIPVVEEEAQGFCRFVFDYNECNLRKADLMVVAGQHIEAKTFYELLMHFDCCGMMKHRLQERLLWLTKLEQQKDKEQILENFKGPHGGGALVPWATFETTKARVVSNLLSIATVQITSK